MSIHRNKLYLLIFIAFIAGYVWLYFGLTNDYTKSKLIEVCPIKHITNIPCPSCGSTRSVILLTKGNLVGAFRTNPFGYIIAIIMLLTPLWITFDIVFKRKTFFEFYKKIESYLKRPQFAIPLILLVIINWIWNITKGL
jgi:hypothetical protein